MDQQHYFLPYQQRWLADQSRVKIWEKSRRIGATYAQAYEDVRDAAHDQKSAHPLKIYFSSADDSAAGEYVDYCQYWAKILNTVAEYLGGDEFLDEDKDVQARRLRFKSGANIYALTSNPRRFRSKGGKVILDEFAFHDDQVAMWRACRPTIMWGHPLRILSTYNGKGNKYYQFVDGARKGALPYSLHSTPIQLAVEEGLADKIQGRALSQPEREQWLADERASVADEDTWLQEYCCVPVDEATALLPYELLAKQSRNGLICELDATEGDLYLGMDIGRKKDLTVIWVLERSGPVMLTRRLAVLEKTPFRQQRETLFSLLAHPRLRRACLDATGLGMQLAEEAQEKFGTHKVEAVTFTSAVREELAFGLKSSLEDGLLWLPDQRDVHEDLHSLRKSVTVAGNIRLDVGHADVKGHGDRFWACALARHAAGQAKGPVHVVSGLARKTGKLLSGTMPKWGAWW